MHYLSIVAIVKDEPDLQEWVHYHQLVGVEHFYVYDNESKIPVQETLKKEIADGIVSVFPAVGRALQMVVYTRAIYQFGKSSKWLAAIDADEYFNPKVKDTVPEVLQDYEDYGGLSVNWRIFGSNGHIQRPNGLVVENYTKAGSMNWNENLHCKTVFQPAKTLRCGTNPHFFIYKGDNQSVSENFDPVENAFVKAPCVEKIQLNHYCLKSLEDWKLKIAKGRIDTDKFPGKSLDDFQKFDCECVEEDISIQRFIPKLKEAIANAR